jgi:thiosulfate reductase cytochrome b subunit
MSANSFTAAVEGRVQANEPRIAPQTGAVPRHLAVVRVTHWLMAASVLGLVVSGVGILISHPRLYWGETGAIGTPSLIDLPLPMIIGPSVWNRPIHFLFAWFLLFAGVIYLFAGVVTRHFRRDLLPKSSDLNWQNISGVISAHLRWKRTEADEAWTYNVVQRLTYLGVVFVIFPGIIWTGLAMSFAVTSVFPFLATLLGGHQSARTLHFAFVSLLVLFLIVHLAMLCLVGFRTHVQAMLTGKIPQGRAAQ